MKEQLDCAKHIHCSRSDIMKIGIFDSGMGGLSVLHRALRMIPEADFLYYADEEHVHMGKKQESKSGDILTKL